MGQDGPGQVILGRQRRQHLPVVLLHGGAEQLRLPPGQTAVLHVQNGIAALARAPIQTPHIGIRAQAGDDRLLFPKRGDGIDPIPQGRRLLEAQCFRLCLHLCRHLPQQLLGLALQQLAGLPDTAVVLLLRHLRPAEAIAAAHVEIQARPLRADILRELPAASRQAQSGEDRIDGLARLRPAAKGAKVPGAVPGDAVDQGKARIRSCWETHEGIAFIILEQDIVMGHMPFDQGVLQHQRLKFAGDENGVEAVHLGHHLPGLGRMSRAVLKILADPVFQLFRLADIDDLSRSVHHQVDPRAKGQVIGLFLQFFSGHTALPPPPHRAG